MKPVMSCCLDPQITLMILFLLTSFVSQAKSQNLVETTCKKFKDYNFCISVFKGKSNSGVISILAGVPIETALPELLATGKKLESMTTKTKDLMEIARLTLCKADFDIAFGSYKNALTTLSGPQPFYAKAHESLQMGMNSLNTCQNLYRTAKPPGVFPIPKENDYILKLADVSILFIKERLR